MSITIKNKAATRRQTGSGSSLQDALRGKAQVIGGAKGLGKTVSSISVLESVDPGVLVQEVFPHDKYSGSEIVITGRADLSYFGEWPLSN